MSSLFEISEDYKELIEKIETLYENMNEENKEENKAIVDCLLSELDDKDKNLNNKFDNYSYLIRKKENENAEIKWEIDRLKRRLIRNKNIIDRLKSFLLYIIKKLNKTKIETIKNTISIRKNNPAVNIIDEKAIPCEYKEEVITEKILKKKIAKELKSGEVVHGCELTQSERIDIK